MERVFCLVVWGWAAEVLVAYAVAVALQREDLGVVDETVDHRCGDDLVAEDLPPGREGLVGGDDQRCSLVGSARGTRTPRGRARRALPSPVPPPSARKMCASSEVLLMLGSARHAREGTQLHVDLRAAAANATQPVELALMGGIGDGEVPSEGAGVPGDNLSRVKRGRADLMLADVQLHAPTGKARVERVVVSCQSESRAAGERVALRSAVGGSGSARIRPLSSIRRSAGTARMPR